MSEEYSEELRVEAPSRACDACRKMKIKCIDKENPPCKRCRHMRLQCRFAMAPVPRVVLEEQEATKGRLEQLEGHVSGIYQKLDEMSNILVRLASGGGPTPPVVGSLSPRTLAACDGTVSERQGVGRAGSASSGHAIGPFSVGPPTNASGSTPWSRDDYAPPSGMPLSADSVAPFIPPNVLLDRGILTEPSAMGDEDEDVMANAINGEPFKNLTAPQEAWNLAAARRLKTREGPALKRRRTDPVEAYEHSNDLERAGSTGDWGNIPMREAESQMRPPADPVELGLITEREGKALLNAFFKYAHPFIPVFDPREDTWEKLRKRSPFCITVIILIAIRQRERTEKESELSRILQEQVERMTKLTFFSPVATLDTVQGLAVLISYSEHAWRTCCHAMALAVDMRLYRCLPYLHKIRTDSSRPHHMLERQRPLVVGARVWLALVRLSYEISYNHALPILFPSQRGRSQYARGLLEHPLSTLHDSRLVVSVEMCEVREPAFLPYESVSTQNQVEMDELLRKANHGINELYDYWLEFYERIGLPPEDFLRVELEHQRAYAILFTNSPAWYGVQKREDVKYLSPERQRWVSAAMRSAAFLVSSVANKRLEKDSEFGNHNFHVGIVATARYLIRMAELLPDVTDLHQISLDIDHLLLKLPNYVVGPFVDGLRRTVARARKGDVLPYTQMSEAAEQYPLSTSPPVTDTMSMYPGFNPFPWNDPVQTMGPGSASVPDSGPLVSGGLGPIDPIENVSTPLSHPVPPIQWPEDINIANWFPHATPDEQSTQLDSSALDADMANWFPAAPQVWAEETH